MLSHLKDTKVLLTVKHLGMKHCMSFALKKIVENIVIIQYITS